MFSCLFTIRHIKGTMTLLGNSPQNAETMQGLIGPWTNQIPPPAGARLAGNVFQREFLGQMAKQKGSDHYEEERRKSEGVEAERSCFRVKSWMARRDEGEYSSWVFDRGATKPGGFLLETLRAAGPLSVGRVGLVAIACHGDTSPPPQHPSQFSGRLAGTDRSTIWQ